MAETTCRIAPAMIKVMDRCCRVSCRRHAAPPLLRPSHLPRPPATIRRGKAAAATVRAASIATPACGSARGSSVCERSAQGGRCPDHRCHTRTERMAHGRRRAEWGMELAGVTARQLGCIGRRGSHEQRAPGQRRGARLAKCARGTRAAGLGSGRAMAAGQRARLVKVAARAGGVRYIGGGGCGRRAWRSARSRGTTASAWSARRPRSIAARGRPMRQLPGSLRISMKAFCLQRRATAASGDQRGAFALDLKRFGVTRTISDSGRSCGPRVRQ